MHDDDDDDDDVDDDEKVFRIIYDTHFTCTTPIHDIYTGKFQKSGSVRSNW